MTIERWQRLQANPDHRSATQQSTITLESLETNGMTEPDSNKQPHQYTNNPMHHYPDVRMPQQKQRLESIVAKNR